jgi:hypothetical protein
MRRHVRSELLARLLADRARRDPLRVTFRVVILTLTVLLVDGLTLAVRAVLVGNVGTLLLVVTVFRPERSLPLLPTGLPNLNDDANGLVLLGTSNATLTNLRGLPAELLCHRGDATCH